jgi:uncharacterized protein YjbI with pentapeptide repeats/Flp pilus assembly protein TadD
VFEYTAARSLMDMQRGSKLLAWFAAGVAGAGAILDAVSNSVSLLTPAKALWATGALFACWAALELIVWCSHPPLRKTAAGISVRKLGMQPRLAFAGAASVLWVPVLFPSSGGAGVRDASRLSAASEVPSIADLVEKVPKEPGPARMTDPNIARVRAEIEHACTTAPDVSIAISALRLYTRPEFPNSWRAVAVEALAGIARLQRQGLIARPPTGFLDELNLQALTSQFCDLSFADMKGANLMGSVFKQCDLSNADLSHSALHETTFEASVFGRTSLSEVHASQASFKDSLLALTSFANSNLERTNFGGATLFATSFRDANLSSCSFEATRIIATDFAGAMFGSFSTLTPSRPCENGAGVDFTEALFAWHATASEQEDSSVIFFPSLNEYQLVFPPRLTTRFSKASLRFAKFTGSCLRDVDFAGATLVGASFRNATLSGTNFLDAKLDCASFEGSLYAHAMHLDKRWTPSGPSAAASRVSGEPCKAQTLQIPSPLPPRPGREAYQTVFDVAELLKPPKDPARAVDFFTQRLRKQETPTDLTNRGAKLLELLRYDEAEKDIRRAIALAPTEPGHYCNLGKLFLDTSRLEHLATALATMGTLRPRLSCFHNLTGILAARSGSMARAKDEFLRAVAIDAKDESAQINLARALIETGEAHEVSKVTTAALSQLPTSWELHAYGAKAAARDSDWVAVEQHLDSVRALSPDHPSRISALLNELAKICRDMGSSARAATFEDRARAKATPTSSH